MRHLLLFALIAVLVVVPMMAVLAVVAELTTDDATAPHVAAPPRIAVESVALRALSLLRAPPV